ncbi:MAG: hypothetical protein HY288_07580, partial [Planctomycetia bacterium]|nr:hypothetical protein [Planctomycetia bacterium]
MKLYKFVAPLILVAMVASIAAAQGVDQNSSDLPPQGVYLTPSDVHAMYSGPGLAIVLSAVQHQPFANGDPVTGKPVDRTVVNGGQDELEQFSSSVSGLVSINGGPQQPVS